MLVFVCFVLTAWLLLCLAFERFWAMNVWLFAKLLVLKKKSIKPKSQKTKTAKSQEEDGQSPYAFLQSLGRVPYYANDIAVERWFTVVESLKLVTVFALALSPSSFLTFQCTVPAEFTSPTETIFPLS